MTQITRAEAAAQAAVAVLDQIAAQTNSIDIAAHLLTVAGELSTAHGTIEVALSSLEEAITATAGRAQGKQKGAPGANLAWSDAPDERKDRFPQGSCECGHDLGSATDLGVVDSYQQVEIPLVVAELTQFDQHAVACRCGKVHTETRPEGARTGPVGYGPNLQALAVFLMVAHHIPVHRCVLILQSLTGAKPSVGFVHGMLARTANREPRRRWVRSMTGSGP